MASERFGWNTIFRQARDGASNFKKWVAGKPVPGGPLRDQQGREAQAKQKLERGKTVREYKMEEGKSGKSSNPLEKDPPKPNYDSMDSEESWKKFDEAVERLNQTSDKDFSKVVSDSLRDLDR